MDNPPIPLSGFWEVIRVLLVTAVPLVVSWAFKKWNAISPWVHGLPDLAKAALVIAINAGLGFVGQLVGVVFPDAASVTPSGLEAAMVGLLTTLIFRLARRA